MFCLRREIANDVAAVFGSEESLSSLLPLPDHSITPLHSLSAPIACLSLAVRLGRMLAASKACQERAGDRRSTTEKTRGQRPRLQRQNMNTNSSHINRQGPIR